MSLVSIQNIGKAFRHYRSEWLRFAAWLKIPTAPYHEDWVLRNISFNIEPGEAIGIVGKNGSGKSTLLKMITGTLQPTEGIVHVQGRIAAILELGMGFDPELSGRQNAYHTAGLMGFSSREIARLMPIIEDFSEIGSYFEQPVRTYSSGMYSRVAFAVATAVKPDLLIVDEALSVGDAYFQAKCYDRIADYKSQGMALLLVTHSVSDIVKHCTRALLLKSGGVAKDGLPRDVTNLHLDELFGKNSQEQIISGKPNTKTFAAGSQDLFATRPGYRKEEHCWGQGGAAIIDYLIVAENEHYPSQLISNSKACFYFKVLFDQNFDDVVPGFLIKTLEGIYLYGTNSYLLSAGKKSISVKQGDQHVFKFALPVSLNAGHYLVSFGVSSGNSLENLIPLHRRYDSVLINVERIMPFGGITDLGALFEIEAIEILENTL